MNKLATLLTLPMICSTFVACSSSSKRQVEVPAGYTAKSNGSFVLQPYKEVIYDNGLKVIFVRDTTLPRVSLTMMIRAGSVLEAERVAGLNALTAYMLEQGTQKKNATQIADDFGQLGTSLDINPGNDVTTIYSDSLNTGAQDLLTFFADVVMNPAFNDREIFRMRSQMQAALQKKIDDPSSFASHKMDDFLYGKHPYARDIHGTLESLRRISKQDVIKHYLTFFRPNNASLAVVGDFDEAYENKVREVFSAWTKRTVPAVNITSAVAPTQLQVRLVVKKGLQQTQIRIAQLGIPRNHPDYLPLRLSNEILGGSFASRLNQTVRDDLGLTYSIRSYFDTKKEVGSFDISTFTKNETAGKALEETLKVISDYVKNGADKKELAAGKSQLIGQFPRAIETADRLAYNLLALDFYGIPVDYLTKFNANVENIDLKAANQAFARIINPERLKVVVYGDASIIPQFSKYNPEIERLP